MTANERAAILANLRKKRVHPPYAAVLAALFVAAITLGGLAPNASHLGILGMWVSGVLCGISIERWWHARSLIRDMIATLEKEGSEAP